MHNNVRQLWQHPFTPEAIYSSMQIRKSLVTFAISFPVCTYCFAPRRGRCCSLVTVQAKPQRLQENVDGVLYVNDKCINCAACSMMAPATFRRAAAGTAHVVYKQPSSPCSISKARSAMAACPVSAIRVGTLAELRHNAVNKTAVEEAWTVDQQLLVDQLSLSRRTVDPFPRRFLDDTSLPVYWLGYHNEASFGAVPYLLQTRLDGSSKVVNIMIDTPKYSKRSVDALERITGPRGPDYLVMTHVDDTADHEKWAAHYQGTLQRVFHSDDLGRNNWRGDKRLEDVEILLRPSKEISEDENTQLVAYAMDGSVLAGDWRSKTTPTIVLLHTPGHSPGSITIWDRSHRILFTGDTYAYSTRNGGCMTGFPRYGCNPIQQAVTIRKLLELPEWQIVAPGHGHPRDYRTCISRKGTEMAVALNELQSY